MYNYWKKGEDKQLSQHFHAKEFTCQCTHSSCIDQMISIDLINKLESMRIELGQPIKITSGFRCPEHQADLRESGIQTAVGKSTHEMGNAVDLSCPVPIDDLVKIAAKQFQAIGIAHTWIHCDLRGPQIRRWRY